MVGKIDPNDFIRSFPRWYSPVKWGVPLSIALLTGLFTALLITNVVAIPAALSALSWLPAFYQGLESLGAFTLMTLSIGLVSTMSAFAASIFTRVCLYPYVENLAFENLSSNRNLATFQSYFNGKDDQHEQALVEELNNYKEELNNYKKALLAASQDNKRLVAKVQYCKAKHENVKPETEPLQAANDSPALNAEKQQADEEEIVLPTPRRSKRRA